MLFPTRILNQSVTFVHLFGRECAQIPLGREATGFLPSPFFQLRELKQIFSCFLMFIEIKTMQMFSKIRLTFPTNKVIETNFLKAKFTGTFTKYRFTEFFFAQSCLQITQTYTIPHRIDVRISLPGTVTFIQCFSIRQIDLS